MNSIEQQQKAMQMFREGSDPEFVAYELGVTEELAHAWYDVFEALQHPETTLDGLDEDGVKVLDRAVAVMEKSLNIYTEEKEQETERSKRAVVLRFKAFIQWLKTHADCQVEIEGFKTLVKKFRTLLNDIQRLADNESSVFMNLFIWVQTSIIIENFEERLIESAGEEIIELTFDENEIDFFNNSLDIEEFEDELKEEVEEQDLSGLDDEFQLIKTED